MLRRKVTALLQTVCLLLTAFSLLLGFSYFTTGSPFGVSGVYNLATHANTTKAENGTSSTSKLGDSPFPEQNSSSIPKEGSPDLLRIAPSYVKAIMTPDDNTFARLECPVPKLSRYGYLQQNSTNSPVLNTPRRYLFALDLHDCAHVLPRLLGSIIETIRFLGPQNCVLSVVEGRSVDGTFEILKLLREEVEGLGAKYYFTTNEIHPKGEGIDRIASLADLRNQALQPLVDHPTHYSADTTVIFINDVAICFEDILELIHQRLYQDADMICAMDWTSVGPEPTFYDVWVARGMNGYPFFNIPRSGSWDNAWNLFWNNPEAKKRLDAGRPFQVYSCWNGATAFTAKPLLERKIKFRSRYEDECYQGEPQLFCKEMWYNGYGKIAVVPSINLEYSDEAAKKIKSLKGYVSKWVDVERRNSLPLRIKWEPSPPDQTKCIVSWEDQYWVPWDEQLAEHTSPA